MSFIKEFKEFAVRGNVVDMAVGVIIGAAFGRIVSSLVGDIVMPILGLMVGGIDFTGFKLVLRDADPAAKVTELSLSYGNFAQTVFDFTIVAFAIFLAIKAINRVRKETPAAPPEPSKQEVLSAEIRDILRTK